MNNSYSEEDIVFERKTCSGIMNLIILVRNSKLKPYLEYTCYKEIASFLADTGDSRFIFFKSLPKEVSEIHKNIFSNLLMLPNLFFSKKILEVDYSKDFVEEIVRLTNLPRIIVNQRIVDIIK